MHPRARTLLIALATATLVLAAPLAAQAHIRIEPAQERAGTASSQVAFSVPTESAGVTTTAVEIELPIGTPLFNLYLQPTPGWTGTITTSPLKRAVTVGGVRHTTAPSRITWTANPGTVLATGQFQTFQVLVGPIPETGRIVMPATQTFSDGTLVRWDDVPPRSGSNPDHPAPTLYVNDPVPVLTGGMSGMGGMSSGGSSAGSATTSTPFPPAMTIALIALGLALIGAVLGALAFVRSIRSNTRASARPAS